MSDEITVLFACMFDSLRTNAFLFPKERNECRITREGMIRCAAIAQSATAPMALRGSCLPVRKAAPSGN